jgi:hypothetical protein
VQFPCAFSSGLDDKGQSRLTAQIYRAHADTSEGEESQHVEH